MLTLHLSEFERRLRPSRVASNLCSRIRFDLLRFHYRFLGFKFGTHVNLDWIEEKREVKGEGCDL